MLDFLPMSRKGPSGGIIVYARLAFILWAQSYWSLCTLYLFKGTPCCQLTEMRNSTTIVGTGFYSLAWLNLSSSPWTEAYCCIRQYCETADCRPPRLYISPALTQMCVVATVTVKLRVKAGLRRKYRVDCMTCILYSI